MIPQPTKWILKALKFLKSTWICCYKSLHMILFNYCLQKTQIRCDCSRTLETIWDDKQEHVNPFTHQPLNINNFIPQAELRWEMQLYIVNRSNLALSLKFIPVYTQVLSQEEMIILLNELILDYQASANIVALQNLNKIIKIYSKPKKTNRSTIFILSVDF